MLGHREIVRCACGCEYVAAWDPDALAREYAAAYYDGKDDPRIDAWAEAHAAEWDGLVDLLSRRAPDANSLLDVGAGTGGFLRRVRIRWPRWRLGAVESDEAASAALARRLPDVEAVDLHGTSSSSWDAVTLLQTLEHLERPGDVLRAVRGLLAPDGALLLTVPNRRAIGVLFRGTGAACYRNGTHLSFFDRRDVERLLEGAGFARVERVVSVGGGRLRFGPAVAAQYALRRLGRSSELRYLAHP